VAAPAGSLLLIASTLLHPLGADPNDAPAAFAEYAADDLYLWSHLGQFLGFCLLAVALVALAATIEAGAAAALARIGVFGAAVGVAMAAALQAVDGIALKQMVDRWVAASGEERVLAFEAAFAVRQVEIGLASLVSLSFGLTLSVLGVALFFSARYPNWIGGLGVLGGLGLLGAGVAQGTSGFSELAMTLSMASSLAVLGWAVLAGVLMWRLAPR
jgi:hypothetical protein